MTKANDSKSAPESWTSPGAAADGLAMLIGMQDGERRAYLAEGLTQLTYDAETYRSVDAAGSPSGRANDARSIESACNRILAAFSVDDQDFDLEAAPKTSPAAAIVAFQIVQIVRPDRHKLLLLVDEESRNRIIVILKRIIVLRDAARLARQRAEQEMGERAGGRRRAEYRHLTTVWSILRP